MDWTYQAAEWLRRTLAQQPWLDFLEPTIARTPDWALLATGPALLLLVAVMLGLIWPKRSRASRRTGAQSTSTSKAPRLSERLAPKAPAATPPTVATAASRTTPPAPTQLPSAADDDGNRSVRVFVSSTFLDMQRERDALVRQTFPALRAKFRARGVELLEVDLRWGITQEQSESGKTLPTLLAEIDRCRPYFIGLLGERYGWVPQSGVLTDELKAAYPTIADATGCSVTELEIIHGVLGNPESAKHGIFLERDPAWLESQSAEERAVYVADSDEARAKLADLKARIHASGAMIIAYEKPEDIGPAVEAALAERIEAQFPEADAPDAFTQTARLHAAYARERRGLHIGAAPYMSALDAWVSQANPKPMLITGASGGGKSTLVANWLAHHRTQTPNDIVFEHYLGASPDSADPILLIRRLWDRLNRATGEALEQQPSHERTLIDGLPQRLAMANAFAERSGVNVLIVLDGLDKLSSQQDLRWVPTYLPPRVRLLASSIDGATRSASEGRGWATLEVKPLTEAQRQEFIDGALKTWGRALSPARTKRILESPLSSSPLFLKTLLDELRVTGIESEFNARLNDYLAAHDIPSLFGRVLQRLEGDCGADFVRAAASLIWASRAGLEEREIIAITRATPLAWAMLRNGLGDTLRDQAGRIAFSHDFLRQAVTTRYVTSNDKKREAHLKLADHLDKRWPDTDERRSAEFFRLAGDAPDSLTGEAKRVADLALADHYEQHRFANRWAEEFPYQLRAAEAWDRLKAVLVDLDRFRLLASRGNVEMLGYWLAIQKRGHNPADLLCGALEARFPTLADGNVEGPLLKGVILFLSFAGFRDARTHGLAEAYANRAREVFGDGHQQTIISEKDLASSLRERGDYVAAEKIERRALDQVIRGAGEDHPLALNLMSNLALTLEKRGDLEVAKRLHQRALEGFSREFGADHPNTLGAMNNLASNLASRGDLSGAQKLMEKVLDVKRRTLGQDDPATLVGMNNVAWILSAQGHHDQAAEIYERVVAVQTQVLGHDHPTTMTTRWNLVKAREAVRLNKLKSVAGRAEMLMEQGDLRGALGLFESALKSRESIQGAEHADTLSALNDLTLCLYAMNDLANAQILQERLLEAQSRTLGPEHPHTLGTMNNLAGTLSARGDPEGAQRLFERLLEARERTVGLEHTSTLRVMNNLATVLSTRGDLDGAERLQTRALEIQTRLMGKEHPDTRTFAHNLAATRAAIAQRSA